MDLGNIIFVGLVVIAVISNIAKVAKKTQAAKPLVGRPLAEATVIQTQQTVPAQVRRNNAKPEKTISAPPLPMFVEGEGQLPISIEKEIQTTGNVEKYDFSNPAEIRKGIIFSEIFNRKY